MWEHEQSLTGGMWRSDSTLVSAWFMRNESLSKRGRGLYRKNMRMNQTRVRV